MTKKMSREKPVAFPFVAGGDGRIYISEALVLASAVTKTKVTDSARAAS